MTGNASKVMLTDLGKGAVGVTIYGTTSNRSQDVRDLTTRLDKPAKKAPPKQPSK
jgi:hypothetical protein